MIYFDELSVAQEMEASTTAVDEYKRSDLLLYAKYLRYKAITESGKDYNNVTVEDMEQLDKTFIKGNVLKAEELNELVSKINELVDGSLILGNTKGTAYDGAAGAALEQLVRELAGGTGTMYSVYVRNNMASLGFAAQYGEECILDFTFVSQYRDDLSEPYKPTGELGLCTIMVKNSKYVDFTMVKQMEVSSNVSIKQDVAEWLSSGSNNLKITVKGQNTDLSLIHI